MYLLALRVVIEWSKLIRFEEASRSDIRLKEGSQCQLSLKFLARNDR
jgi:hypothetical protein